MEIRVSQKVRESEKAELLTFAVCWGDGNIKTKDIWVPKSCIESVNGLNYKIANWFVEKQEKMNAFKGYLMRFEFAF